MESPFWKIAVQVWKGYNFGVKFSLSSIVYFHIHSLNSLQDLLYYCVVKKEFVIWELLRYLSRNAIFNSHQRASLWIMAMGHGIAMDHGMIIDSLFMVGLILTLNEH